MNPMGIVLFIAVFSILVITHELGHFLCARRMGIAVEEFGIGFPPRIWSRRWSGTIVSINAIPLGGFVRLQGEDRADGRSDSFLSQPVFKRMAVVASGVIMNALLAYGITVVVLSAGVPQVISEFNIPADVRDSTVYVANVLPHTPAQRALIKPNDRITAIDGVAIHTVEEMRKLLTGREGIATAVTVERNATVLDVTLTPTMIPADPPIVGIGVELVHIGTVRYRFPQSLLVAAQTTWWQLKGIVQGLSSVVTTAFQEGRIPEDLSGPVGIASIIARSRHEGWSSVAALASILSLNLALLNLLPIPALDGGRLFFLLIELLRRKRIAFSIESRMHQAGFVILLFLIVLITIRDLQMVFS